MTAQTKHEVSLFSLLEGSGDRYELECDVCGYVGAADSFDEARAIARVHEEFVGVLVGLWQV